MQDGDTLVLGILVFLGFCEGEQCSKRNVKIKMKRNKRLQEGQANWKFTKQKIIFSEFFLTLEE